MKKNHARLIVITLLSVIAGSAIYFYAGRPRIFYPRPTITKVAPFVLDQTTHSAVPVPIVISGTNFQPGAKVSFYHAEGVNTTVISSTEIRAEFPPDQRVAGWYDILETNPDGTTAILKSGLGVRNSQGEIPAQIFSLRYNGNRVESFAAEGIPLKQQSPQQLTVTATNRDGVMVSAGVRPDGPSFAGDLGAKWIRLNALLGDGKPPSNANKYLDVGINTVITLTYQNPNNIDTTYSTLALSPSAGFPFTDKTVFQNDVAATVTPLVPYLNAGRNIVLQYENEISDVTQATKGKYWAGTTAQYLASLDAFYEKVKAIDPRFQVALSSFTSEALEAVINTNNSKFTYQSDRLSTMLADPNFDIADLHFYGCPSTIAAKAQWVREHMATNKQWMTTENAGPMPNYCDYPQLPEGQQYVDWTNQTQVDQFESAHAKQVTERMTDCAASGGVVCILFSEFNLDGEADSFNHLGLLTQETVPVKKEAYEAFKAYTGSLSNQAPILTVLENKTVYAGSLLSFIVTGYDPDNNPVTYSATNLPAGATFSGQTFTWTPTQNQIGTYPGIHFTISDGVLTDSQDITIDVLSNNQAPSLSPIGNKTIAENQPLTFVVQGTDPNRDALTYTVSNNPAGSTLVVNTDGTATFSWKPSFSQSGVYPNVHFVVSDGKLSDFEDIAITVNNTNQSPVLTPIGNKTVTTGKTLTFTVNGSDPDGTVPELSASNLPKGATFKDNKNGTGTFLWNTTNFQSGTYSKIHFVASDGTAKDSEDITITVKRK